MKQFYFFISCFLLIPFISYAQPDNYAWIAEFDGNYSNTRLFSDGASGNFIRTLTVQADSNNDEFVIEWDSFFNEWTNFSAPFNTVFTLTWNQNGTTVPNSVLSTPATSGSYYTIQIDGLDYSNRKAVIMETTGAPVGFDVSSSTVQTPPSNITDGTPVTVFGTLAAAPNTELRIFIRYSTDGFATSDVVEMTNSIAGFPEEVDGVIPGTVNTASTTVDYYLFTTTVDATTITDESEYDLISIDIENNNGSNYSYTVRDIQTTTTSGNWNDPNTWTSGSVPNTNDVVELNHFVTVASDISHSGNITINSPNVLIISAGQSLTHTGTFVNNGGIIINSNSTSYGSLIASEFTGTGDLQYFRFVNSNANGNDLIAPPVSGQGWSDFLSSGNASALLDDGNTTPTTYAFGPFDKSAGDYNNFTDATSVTLNSGVGYRAATDSGSNLAFTGSVETGIVTNDIQSTGTSFTDWNLIGNPYPSYIDMEAFLNTDAGGLANHEILSSGIYGYDATSPWDVITRANASGELMAPGQGFFVEADPADVAAYDLTFDPSIRRTGSSDDFIAGRDANDLTFLELRASTTDDSYVTDFYFNDNSTQALDPGYDAIIFGGVPPAGFSLYSLTADGSSTDAIALQSLNTSDVNNVTIPLGVHSNSGEQLTFTIDNLNLPSGTEVFLDDTVENTSTLLTSGDYVLTPSSDLTGPGRFFIRFTNSVLSVPGNNTDPITIFTHQDNETLIIHGLSANTNAEIYDIRGRHITSQFLIHDSNPKAININTLDSGIYIVKLHNDHLKLTQKIIKK